MLKIEAEHEREERRRRGGCNVVYEVNKEQEREKEGMGKERDDAVLRGKWIVERE